MNILFFLLPKAQVEYLFGDFSLRQAIEKMEFHRYSVVPVVSRDGKYLYSLSEGDILYTLKNSKYYQTNAIEFGDFIFNKNIPVEHFYQLRDYMIDRNHVGAPINERIETLLEKLNKL